MEKSFVMHVSGWVSFVMQEPLSGEKMWIKRLELETTDIRGVDIYGAGPDHGEQWLQGAGAVRLSQHRGADF